MGSGRHGDPCWAGEGMSSRNNCLATPFPWTWDLNTPYSGPTFSYLEHSLELFHFSRLSLFWCCCDLLYWGKWGEVWRQICLLPNFLAAANPQKEAPPNWKRNSPTFGQVLFFLIILIHFLSRSVLSFKSQNKSWPTSAKGDSGASSVHMTKHL